MPGDTANGTTVDALWRAIYIVGYRAALVWWFVRRPQQRGAYVAVWHADELLMIRNSYKRGETFPCGGVARGESPLEAARRELREEVGIDVTLDRLVPTELICFQNEYKRDEAHFFELRLDSRPKLQLDHREVVAAEFVPTRGLFERPLVPAVRRYLERRHDLSPRGRAPS
jgi:ADP-ribose pyrophosphatase YjhB (NUDIX family)